MLGDGAGGRIVVDALQGFSPGTLTGLLGPILISRYADPRRLPLVEPLAAPEGTRLSLPFETVLKRIDPSDVAPSPERPEDGQHRKTVSRMRVVLNRTSSITD